NAIGDCSKRLGHIRLIGTGRSTLCFWLFVSRARSLLPRSRVHEAGPGQRRRSIIEALEMNASRLLAAARYERITVEITRAVVGLDEARHYLVEYDAKNR